MAVLLGSMQAGSVPAESHVVSLVKVGEEHLIESNASPDESVTIIELHAWTWFGAQSNTASSFLAVFTCDFRAIEPHSCACDREVWRLKGGG